MAKIIFYIGFLMFYIGASTIDNESLAIPMALTAVGLILMGVTKKEVLK